eukprot:jgi/Galph1/2379/GphlegSOOS_G1057.1
MNYQTRLNTFIQQFGRTLQVYWRGLFRILGRREKEQTVTSGRFFGNNIVSPWKTFGQIILLQIIFYVSLLITLWLLETTFGVPFQSFWQQLFDYEYWKADTLQGYLIPGAFFLNEVWMAGWFLPIVQRAKRCLDFSVTMYLIHFIFCTLFYGFPYSWSWWSFLLFGIAVSAALGEWLCMRKELQAIILPMNEDSEQQQQEEEEQTDHIPLTQVSVERTHHH